MYVDKNSDQSESSDNSDRQTWFSKKYNRNLLKIPIGKLDSQRYANGILKEIQKGFFSKSKWNFSRNPNRILLEIRKEFFKKFNSNSPSNSSGFLQEILFEF